MGFAPSEHLPSIRHERGNSPRRPWLQTSSSPISPPAGAEFVRIDPETPVQNLMPAICTEARALHEAAHGDML